MSTTIADEERRNDLFERAAWAETDRPLAQAWREAIALRSDLERAHASLKRSLPKDDRSSAGMRRLAGAIDQAEFLLQYIERAAKLRRMQLVEANGVYDPSMHALGDGKDADPGSPIRVDAPAVVQTRASGNVTLVRATVSPAPVPRKRRSGQAS